MNTETKRCPYCGEEILAAAKKCKHCGEWLEEKRKNQVPCKVCGEMIDEDALVCPYCHEKVQRYTPLRPVTEPYGNREFSSPPRKPENEKPRKIYYGDPQFTNRRMFSRPFSFKGRIRRLEYGISFIIYCIWYYIMMGLTYMFDDDETVGIGIFFFISGIFMLWFLWAQNCKRCHDMDHCGWWQLIPFFNPFALLFCDGYGGENEYGDNPKGGKE